MQPKPCKPRNSKGLVPNKISATVFNFVLNTFVLKKNGSELGKGESAQCNVTDDNTSNFVKSGLIFYFTKIGSEFGKGVQKAMSQIDDEPPEFSRGVHFIYFSCPKWTIFFMSQMDTFSSQMDNVDVPNGQ